jgi:hypothetical protein
MGNRDELWKATWETLYDASYYEVLFAEVLKRWQAFDIITRLLVAITASGSAVAGWALWNDDNYKILWLVVAGIASLLSIIHATLNTPDRVKNYTKLSNVISHVRLDYETFQHELKIYPDFDVDANFNKFKELRSKYQKALESFSPDFLTTDKARHNAQTILNTKLGIKE